MKGLMGTLGEKTFVFSGTAEEKERQLKSVSSGTLRSVRVSILPPIWPYA